MLKKGPNSSNQGTAIWIGAEGVTPRTVELTIRNNKFTNDQPSETVFLRNLFAMSARLVANSFKGQLMPLVGNWDSAMRRRLRVGTV